jgi:hypothetical protein
MHLDLHRPCVPHHTASVARERDDLRGAAHTTGNLVPPLAVLGAAWRLAVHEHDMYCTPNTATLSTKSALPIQWHELTFLLHACRLSIDCVVRYYRYTMSIMPEQDSACFRREPLVSRQLHRETDATTFMPVKQRPLQPCHLIQKRCPAIDFSGALATNVNNP